MGCVFSLIFILEQRLNADFSVHFTATKKQPKSQERLTRPDLTSEKGQIKVTYGMRVFFIFELSYFPVVD